MDGRRSTGHWWVTLWSGPPTLRRCTRREWEDWRVQQDVGHLLPVCCCQCTLLRWSGRPALWLAVKSTLWKLWWKGGWWTKCYPSWITLTTFSTHYWTGSGAPFWTTDLSTLQQEQIQEILSAQWNNAIYFSGITQLLGLTAVMLWRAQSYLVFHLYSLSLFVALLRL